METKLPLGAVEVDWVKTIAVAGAAAAGVEKVLKVYRIWRAANHVQTAAMGLTVKNGEYNQLLKTLGRIEKRLDAHSQRLETIEGRLAT
jgi:hypothetical protein